MNCVGQLEGFDGTAKERGIDEDGSFNAGNVKSPSDVRILMVLAGQFVILFSQRADQNFGQCQFTGNAFELAAFDGFEHLPCGIGLTASLS